MLLQLNVVRQYQYLLLSQVKLIVHWQLTGCGYKSHQGQRLFLSLGWSSPHFLSSAIPLESGLVSSWLRNLSRPAKWNLAADNSLISWFLYSIFSRFICLKTIEIHHSIYILRIGLQIQKFHAGTKYVCTYNLVMYSKVKVLFIQILWYVFFSETIYTYRYQLVALLLLNSPGPVERTTRLQRTERLSLLSHQTFV